MCWWWVWRQAGAARRGQLGGPVAGDDGDGRAGAAGVVAARGGVRRRGALRRPVPPHRQGRLALPRQEELQGCPARPGPATRRTGGGGGGAAGAPLWSAWDLWLRLAACVALDVVFRHARPPTCRARSVPGIKHLRHTGTVHPACNPPGPQHPRRLKAASCPGRERGRIAGPGRLLGLLARC